MKIKENKKRAKNLNLARELRSLWSLTMMVIPVVIATLGMAPKGLERGLGELEIVGLSKTIETRILMYIRRDLLSFRLPRKIISYRWFEKLIRNSNNNTQPSNSPGKWNAQTPLGFWDTNGSHNLGQTTRHYNNDEKKRERKLVELWTFNHRIKLKESEKKDKYLDLAWELKKKTVEHDENDYLLYSHTQIHAES